MATATGKRQIRVLMVEDNDIYANFIKEALSEGKKADFQVDVRGCLSDGIAAAQEEDYHVILLDLGLPDSEGVETATSLRSNLPDEPIVILTGEDDTSVALEALSKAEAWNYLPKHVTDLNRLEHAVCDAARA